MKGLPLEAEEPDEAHGIQVEKGSSITFFAHVTADRVLLLTKTAPMS